MPLIERVMLSETFLHWSATHVFRLLALVVPSLYLLFNIQAVYAEVPDAIAHLLPFLVVQAAMITWLTRGRVIPLMADLSQLLGATDITKSVFIGLFKPQGHKFQVTAKGGDRHERFRAVEDAAHLPRLSGPERRRHPLGLRARRFALPGGRQHHRLHLDLV